MRPSWIRVTQFAVNTATEAKCSNVSTKCLNGKVETLALYVYSISKRYSNVPKVQYQKLEE
jgi:hypothetical protein